MISLELASREASLVDSLVNSRSVYRVQVPMGNHSWTLLPAEYMFSLLLVLMSRGGNSLVRVCTYQDFQS
jgi:hypothetical protein